MDNMEECDKSPKCVSELTHELSLVSKKRKVILLNFQKINKYVLPPKDYSFVVLFPVSTQEMYNDISESLDNFYRVVKLFTCSPLYEKLFFGIIDLKDGPRIAKKLKLKPSHVLMHFPPSGKMKKADVFYLDGDNRRLKDIKDWIEKRTVIVTNPHPIVSLMYVLPEGLQNVLTKIFNIENLAAFAVAFVIFMMSGDKWVQSHKGHLLYYEDNEQYISRDMFEQFELEGYIVMSLMLFCIGGMIMLIEGAAMQNKNWVLKMIAQILGSTLFYVFFSLLMVVYKIKDGNYRLTMIFNLGKDTDTDYDHDNEEIDMD